MIKNSKSFEGEYFWHCILLLIDICSQNLFFQADKNINDILGKVETLKKQREDCHKELGDVKRMVSFIMQAVTNWNEVVEVTKEATVKTGHIQRIVGVAAKGNTKKILKSKGTQTLMKSFKECWMEVAEMITPDNNNLVLTGKVILRHIKHLFF